VVIHAMFTSMRRTIAVVKSAKECGDGVDAMGVLSRREVRDALQRQTGATLRSRLSRDRPMLRIWARLVPDVHPSQAEVIVLRSIEVSTRNPRLFF
jgi:hypothetical protein